MKKFRIAAVILITCTSLTGFTSCSKDASVTIAEQYGLAYAPVQIMRVKGYLETLEPDVELKWVKLGNTAAIREAVLAGEVDLGFMGLPPFLIGADRGMDWKLVSGLSVCPVNLVAGPSVLKQGGVDSGLGLLTKEHRIALPQPGSIQHILLTMAADSLYHDASRFDDSLVTMKHPDGMAALLSGAVDAHFTSPPYIFMEEAASVPGIGRYETILSGFDAFGGEFTFIGAMVAGSFIDDEPELLESFLTALGRSIDFMNDHPAASAAILAEIYEIPEAQILAYITRDDMKYTTGLFGLGRFINFMRENDYLEGELMAEDLIYGAAGQK